MKKLILIIFLFAIKSQLIAQISAKTEYVPTNFNMKGNDMPNMMKARTLEPLNTYIPIIPQNSNREQTTNKSLAGITYTYSKAEVFDKIDSKSTSYNFESTVTISPDVFDVFLNNEYFQTKIISRFWMDDILVFKTLLPDNTVVTYKQLVADGNKELIIEFPETIIVLGK